jgi:hypothetical protein
MRRYKSSLLLFKHLRKNAHVQRASLSVLTGSAVAPLDGSLPINADYEANKSLMDKYIIDLKAAHSKCLEAGGSTAISRHRARNKLLARERIDELVDHGSPLLELSTLAGWNMYGNGVASGGIITAVGKVNG